MLKNILKLQGAKRLAKKEQQVISGGKTSTMMCTKHSDCAPGYCCNHPNGGGLCTPGGINQRLCR